jgi:hypothetical protein
LRSHGPEEATSIVSVEKLDDRKELGFRKKRPKRNPFRLNPFLASRPKAKLKPMTRLLHVRNFEISNSFVEEKSYPSDGEAGPYPTDQMKKTPK